MTFMFENLDVYKSSVDFVDRTYTLCDNLKKMINGLTRSLDAHEETNNQ